MGKSAEKTVLLGVTGCIAAYKACEIVRGLQKAGVRCKVVMTEHATHFVDPLTFRSLTREPVAIGLFDDPSDPIHHISLAQEADLFLIAPCTANVAAKLAWGLADDLLTTTALATPAPIVVAPAMNANMYENAATQQNLEALRRRGMIVLEPGSGYLACGDEGRGRLPEPEAIVHAALHELFASKDLAGRRVMVTAGPTEEPIDPVRCITNRSSGKTGFALAAAAARRGAQVTLVTGPVALADPAGVQVMRVQTALQMLDAARAAFETCDVAVFSAAVADARPEALSGRKLKKGADDEALHTIRLVDNPDIMATLAAGKRNQVVVGYAAETENVVENARKKLVAKHADFIVANQVGEGRAFGTDTNIVTFVDAGGEDALPEMPKEALADAVLDRALTVLSRREGMQ